MYSNPAASSWTYNNNTTNPAVEEFHHRLPDYNTTPLVSLPEIASQLGLKHVLIKDESQRFGLPAFKILGASWAIYRAVAAKCGKKLDCSLEELGEAARKTRVKLVTCTEGNWGRAVARMGKLLRIPAVVYVPDFMDKATQEKIASEGADVRVVDGDYDASIAAARQESENAGALLVMDTSWPGYEEIPQWVVEGYQTMLVETDKQAREMTGTTPSCAIASVGVGSWAQAVVQHYKGEVSRVSVVTVEPNTAASLKTSLEVGEMRPIKTGHTIMNGMCCGTVSYTAWPILREGVDLSVTVSDQEAHESVLYLHSQDVKNGPCGAAPLAALRKICSDKRLGLHEESVVVLFSTEGARDYPVPEMKMQG